MRRPLKSGEFLGVSGSPCRAEQNRDFEPRRPLFLLVRRAERPGSGGMGSIRVLHFAPWPPNRRASGAPAVVRQGLGGATDRRKFPIDQSFPLPPA